MGILARGAEAVLKKKKEGIAKERTAKGYRHPLLDMKLRTSRTKSEARLLDKARKAGVAVPDVQIVDKTTLLLSKIEGSLVKDVLDVAIAEKIGTVIAKLHDADIIHADLTTSNMIYSDDDVVLIDFGLGYVSKRFEDKAVDIHVFKQALESRHHALKEEAFAAFCKGYSSSKDAKNIMERLQSVESRGRNKKVAG